MEGFNIFQQHIWGIETSEISLKTDLFDVEKWGVFKPGI